MDRPLAKGRGAQVNPPNRFGGPWYEIDLEQVEHDQEYLNSLHNQPTEYIPDNSKSLVSENDSPDVGFRWSINPYRGCAHGCSYCYARPYHEYLGWSAGLDFETKILVKEKAPELFREFLCRNSWQPELIAMSGVTDCYQPCERRFLLTRGCLEVAAEAQQPMGIITKNALVLRDLDILRPMAQANLIRVHLSITTLDAKLARTMEPRTSTPAARLRAVKELSEAGIPVRVLVAPIIPGLNEAEIPAILKAVKEAGAHGAGYTLLRLPLTVVPVFREWLARTQPTKAQRVEGRIRDTRDGKLNDSDFATRMCGTGVIARQIREMFQMFAKRLGLDKPLPPVDCTRFRPPSGQGWLF
jgi:DNA repair photolyase